MKPLATDEAVALPAAVKHFDELPDSAHVTGRVLEALFSVDRSTIARWVRGALLPPPKHFGPQSRRWLVADLRRVLAGKEALVCGRP